MDTVLLKFISENILTITVFLGLLKGLAKITPWAGDDQVVQVFTGAFDKIKGSKKQP